MQTMPVAFILGAGKMTQVNAMYYPAAGQPPIPVFESLPARDAKLKANEKILASIPAKVPLPDETPVVKRKWRSKLRAMDKPETVKPPSPVKMPRRKPIYPKPAYEELPGGESVAFENSASPSHFDSFPGAVRVRETTMEASQFRQLVDINGREWLVYVRFSLQVEPGVYAYDLFFAGRFRSGVRARFVGKIDEPLPGGHMPFKHLDSLHGLQLDRDAWWAINKTRIPMISKTPGANETPFVPHHVIRNEYGQETHEPDAFHRHDFVTYIADGTHIQAFVLARHDPILPSAQRLYVIACLRVREYVVHTVYGKDLRPPEIQCLVRPGPADCWWVKSYDACMQSEPLKYHLGCCPAPRDGFKRGHVVSIPDPLVEGNRLCACVARTWITEGRLMYQVLSYSPCVLVYSRSRFCRRFSTPPTRGASTLVTRPCSRRRICWAPL
jgi:hypothetical protein